MCIEAVGGCSGGGSSFPPPPLHFETGVQQYAQVMSGFYPATPVPLPLPSLPSTVLCLSCAHPPLQQVCASTRQTSLPSHLTSAPLFTHILCLPCATLHCNRRTATLERTSSLHFSCPCPPCTPLHSLIAYPQSCTPASPPPHSRTSPHLIVHPTTTGVQQHPQVQDGPHCLHSRLLCVRATGEQGKGLARSGEGP